MERLRSNWKKNTWGRAVVGPGHTKISVVKSIIFTKPYYMPLIKPLTSHQFVIKGLRERTVSKTVTIVNTKRFHFRCRFLPVVCMAGKALSDHIKKQK